MEPLKMILLSNTVLMIMKNCDIRNEVIEYAKYYLRKHFKRLTGIISGSGNIILFYFLTLW